MDYYFLLEVDESKKATIYHFPYPPLWAFLGVAITASVCLSVMGKLNFCTSSIKFLRFSSKSYMYCVLSMKDCLFDDFDSYFCGRGILWKHSIFLGGFISSTLSPKMKQPLQVASNSKHERYYVGDKNLDTAHNLSSTWTFFTLITN